VQSDRATNRVKKLTPFLPCRSQHSKKGDGRARKDISRNLRRIVNLGTNASVAPTVRRSIESTGGAKARPKIDPRGPCTQARSSAISARVAVAEIGVSSVTERVLNAGRPGWSRFHIVTERNLGVLAAKAPP
jgi:hypothetical protein